MVEEPNSHEKIGVAAIVLAPDQSAKLDRLTRSALHQEGFTGVREGGSTWQRVRREVLQKVMAAGGLDAIEEEYTEPEPDPPQLKVTRRDPPAPAREDEGE